MTALAALIKRDIQIALRVGGGALIGVLFFLIVVVLMPFAIGPDLALLTRLGPAILWLGALLASLLTLDRLFTADHDDGSLDLIAMSRTPLELSCAAKALAHWLAAGIPLVIATPVLGLLLNLDAASTLAVALTLLAGTPALTFTGMIGAALAVTLHRGGLLLAVLVLPLSIPVLIFGVAASEAAISGPVAFGTPFSILCAHRTGRVRNAVLDPVRAVAGQFCHWPVCRGGQPAARTGLSWIESRSSEFAPAGTLPATAATTIRMTMTLTTTLTDLANPTKFLSLTARVLPWLMAATAILLAIGLYMSVMAPDDYQQGATVKIMFIHVPNAWLSMFVWGVMRIAALGTLVWRHPLADVAAKAAAPIGAAFTFLALVTGSLWGRPMWGTYWEWDARLTSVLILFLMYLGLMALWRAVEDPSRAARAAAILTLVGAINLPIIKFSVDWWNTLHQPASVFRMGGPTLDPAFLIPLLVMAVAFSLLFVTLHLAAMRNEILRRRVRSLQMMQAGQQAA